MGSRGWSALAALVLCCGSVVTGNPVLPAAQRDLLSHIGTVQLVISSADFLMTGPKHLLFLIVTLEV